MAVNFGGGYPRHFATQAPTAAPRQPAEAPRKMVEKMVAECVAGAIPRPRRRWPWFISHALLWGLVLLHFACPADAQVRRRGPVGQPGSGHGDGTDCPAGQAARGTDANGNATGCFTPPSGTGIDCASPATLTLTAGGALAIPSGNNCYLLDTFGATSSDDVESVTCTASDKYIFFAANDARTVRFTAAASIQISAPFSLDNQYDTYMATCRATNTLGEIARTNGGS